MSITQKAMMDFPVKGSRQKGIHHMWPCMATIISKFLTFSSLE